MTNEEKPPDKIKERMIEIKKAIDFLANNLDMTGGKQGMRNNNLTWKKIEKLKKELMTCNRKLLNYD